MSLLHQFPAHSLISKKLLFFLITVVFLLCILEIWLVNRLSTFGEQISKMQYSSQSLAMENQTLKNEIDGKVSLKTNFELAKLNAFEPVKNVFVVKSPDIALNIKN